MNILEIHGLNKSFGKQNIIVDLELSVPEGSVFGFVGKNGSGKTTTMKMILGLLMPDSGKIKVCNEKVTFGQSLTNCNIGYLPDVPEFYSYMKPKEYLRLCGEIGGFKKKEISRRSDELLSLVGLSDVDNRIGDFSRGMKQRLGIAQALFLRPRLLICDEPTSALDPTGRKEILEILRKISGETTVIFSTHILSDVERICDNVAVLHNGKIAVSGTLSEIRNLHKKDSILLEFSNDEDLQIFKASLLESRLIDKAEEKGTEITIHSKNIKDTQKTIYSILEKMELYPTKIEILESTLENLFMEVVQ